MSTASAPYDLESLLSAGQLPALPQSAIALLQLSQNPAAGPVEFARPIEADPGLMGQVLKFVNSSYFGFSREIGSIQQALTLVGTRSITNFALWNAVFSVIPNPQFGSFDLKGLWQDSLRRALLARGLGRELRVPNAEDLFAGALLQDMAIPLLLKQMPVEYQDLVTRRQTEGRRLSNLEREAFGWDHAQAAGLLATTWGLPEHFVKLIQNHTQLSELLKAGKADLDAACVAVASLLPSCADEAWSEREEFADGFAQVTAGHAVDMLSLFEQVDEAAADFAPLLKLPTPKRTLVEYWNE